MRRYAIIACVILATLLAAPASAVALTDMQIAYRTFPNAVCTPANTITLWDTPAAMTELTGVKDADGGAALGAATAGDCVIHLNAVKYAAASPLDRCRLRVHEVGHLSGHVHAEGGVMRLDHEGPFHGCDARIPLSDRALKALDARAGGQGSVECGTGPKVIRCSWSNRGHVALWRVRAIGATGMRITRLR
jgi:hypothetical protein